MKRTRHIRIGARRAGLYSSGESHPRVKAPDADVELVRELHEQHGLSYGALAEKFEVPRATIRNWCAYRTRT